MKRCPECRRDYYDDTLLYCLDDGNSLLEGPATAALSEPGAVATGFPLDEPQTAILHSTAAPGEAPTRAKIHTTDQTAVFARGAGAEPRESLGDLSEKQSFSANRAAKPLAALVVAVVLLVGGFFGYKYFSPTKQIESIAVMPFVNESGNADVEYLSDGMTETLISSLSHLAGVSVKPRSSVFRYKGKETSPQIIGSELNVQAIINGRVVQRGNDITLYVELIDAQTDTVLWKGDYNRAMTNLVALQSEIASDVSNKLRAKLSGAEQNQVAKNYTTNTDAYQLYLKGRFYWNKRTGADIKRSIEYFNQAIALDPAYALAYAGLADAYGVLPSYTSDPPPKETYPKARTAALKALEIDAALAEPHAALGVVLHEFDWKFAEAERAFKRAIELNPNYASAHQWYGEYLANMGRFDEAIAEAKRAQQLDPLSLIVNTGLGFIYHFALRYDEAIAQYQKTLEIDPNFSFAHGQLAEAYIAKGMCEEAIEAGRKMRLLQGLPPELVETRTAILNEACRRSGLRGFHQKAIELELEAARKNNTQIGPTVLAFYQVRMGNKDQALDSLEKGFETRENYLRLVQLKTDPCWELLRAEPRFQELLRKVGFPQ